MTIHPKVSQEKLSATLAQSSNNRTITKPACCNRN